MEFVDNEIIKILALFCVRHRNLLRTIVATLSFSLRLVESYLSIPHPHYRKFAKVLYNDGIVHRVHGLLSHRLQRFYALLVTIAFSRSSLIAEVSYCLSLNPRGCGGLDSARRQDTIHQCAEACDDVNQIFASGDAFQNCVSYPAMSGYIGTTDINSPQRKLATSYGIIPNDTTRSQGIINNVTSCFRGYAATLPDCTDPSSQECPLSACATFLNSSTSMTFLDPLGEQGLINGTGMYSCVRAFCNYISDRAIVNVDIGGIGVCTIVQP